MNDRKNVFLTAEWRKLIMANYTVDPAILSAYLPAKTEFDLWQEKCYVSLVGFLFKKVRLKGLPVPFHSRFPEVNLRFYVKYKERGNWKRGVVFISEIVPKPAIAWVANTLFREKYSVCRMKNENSVNEQEITIGYKWKRDRWNLLQVCADKVAKPLAAGSKEAFITEHFWGYAKQNDLHTVEYHVEHPRWDIYTVRQHLIECDFGKLYGKVFSFLQQERPESVFMAEGSPVRIYSRRII